jgi:hypothetical protein
MSTRSTTHFVYGERTEAIIYRHSDGYPEGAGKDIFRFFDDVRSQTKDTRFGDPSYLASKYVVWLADQFRNSRNLLDFLSVGVTQKDPDDIEFRYTIDCAHLDQHGTPSVTCYDIYAKSNVTIP